MEIKKLLKQAYLIGVNEAQISQGMNFNHDFDKMAEHYAENAYEEFINYINPKPYEIVCNKLLANIVKLARKYSTRNLMEVIEFTDTMKAIEVLERAYPELAENSEL